MDDSTQHLLRSQRNLLLQLVQDEGLRPNDFAWELRNGDWSGWVDSEVPALVHVGSGFYCAFALAPEGERPPRGITYQGGQHMVACSPGQETPRDQFFYIPWTDVQFYARQWLQSIKRELSTPDLWTTVREHPNLLQQAGLEHENSQFSQVERERIADSLEGIRTEILASKTLNEKQTEILSAKLDYLREASERLGRKDWIAAAAGSVLSIVIQASLSSEAAASLLRIADQSLSWLWNVVPYLPQ